MSELTKKIKSAGYFKVAISPTKFIPKRIPTLTALFPVIERSQVQLRGWSFPHLNRREDPVPDRVDSISQETEWQHHLEAWRFYQSGQFVDIRGFHTDWLHQRSGLPPGTVNWKQGEILFVEHALYAYAETFEFAARLSSTAAGDDSMSIEVVAAGLANRRLAVADFKRMDFYGSASAKISEFPQEFQVSRSELLTDTATLAVQATQELFRVFGKEVSAELLRDWLRELVRS